MASNWAQRCLATQLPDQNSCNSDVDTLPMAALVQTNHKIRKENEAANRAARMKAREERWKKRAALWAGTAGSTDAGQASAAS